jgi:Tol biopolymer transport system component
MRFALFALVALIAGTGFLLNGRGANAAFPGMGGGAIAFTSNRDGNWEIYVMDGGGRSQTNLTNNPAWDGGPAGPPSWSPDGAKITFASDRAGNFEVYVMDADGSNARRLTNHPAVDGMPSWSWDGSQIVFRASATVILGST